MWRSKNMKKVYKVENLDCAHCAAKLERAIQGVEGVTAATISFMTQRLTIVIEDEKFDSVMENVIKTAKKLNDEWEIKR